MFPKHVSDVTDDYKMIVRMYKKGDLETAWDHRVPLEGYRLDSWVERDWNLRYHGNHLPWKGRLVKLS